MAQPLETAPSSALPEQVRERRASNFEIETWSPFIAYKIYALEKKVWAPWLQKPAKKIMDIAEKYSDTQLLVRDKVKNFVVATLTTNRVTWYGDPMKLTSWDAIAGGSVAESNYKHTYERDGNTLVLMAANVDPDFRATTIDERDRPVHYASQMLVHLRDSVAPKLGVTRIASFFRPSEYGEHKLKAYRAGERPMSFAKYCETTRPEDGKPIDRWLRSVDHLGMKLQRTEDGSLRIAEESMRVEVDMDTFRDYQRDYNPDRWLHVPERWKYIKKTGSTGTWIKEYDTWESGETGYWRFEIIKGKKMAVYTEPNVLGAMDLRATA